jgi:hypothetical protein
MKPVKASEITLRDARTDDEINREEIAKRAASVRARIEGLRRAGADVPRGDGIAGLERKMNARKQEQMREARKRLGR